MQPPVQNPVQTPVQIADNIPTQKRDEGITVLRNRWLLAKGAEKRDRLFSADRDTALAEACGHRIGLAIDKFIDIVSPDPTPKPEIVPEIGTEGISVQCHFSH